MAFRQVYLKKDVYPKVILEKLSASLTHPFKCTECQQRFHKVYEATAHYLTSHQNSNKIKRDVSPDGNYVSQASKKKIPCTICSKTFDRTNMKRHILTVHEGVKPFKCTLCVTTFSTKTHLKRHIAGVHEGKKPHPCAICQDGFKMAKQLRQHMKRVHEEAKPLKCSDCEEGFVMRQELKKH